MKNFELQHQSIMLAELLNYLPSLKSGQLLDVTAGGGGHFFNFLTARPYWRGECWDRDPEALKRIQLRAQKENVPSTRWNFLQREFGTPPSSNTSWDFILADIGISSFQIDDPQRGMSLFSTSPIDFRMNPQVGLDFWNWLKQKTLMELEEIFEIYGEEPKARKLAHAIKNLAPNPQMSAAEFAVFIQKALSYTQSRIHPATRAFQALRIAINDELGQLKSFLSWVPQSLNPGGRLAIISFHSLEDRIVKKAFRDLAETDAFDILNTKPLVPSEEEQELNPRSRSAKLRMIERKVPNAGVK